MSQKEDILTRSFSVIVKTNEIKIDNISASTTIQDLREIIARNVFEPARSIKLLNKDKILSLNDTIQESRIENNSKVIALPCYTMKHGLWNFMDDFNNESNEMQNIKLVYFLQDKMIEKAQFDGNIEYYQPIGIYWQSRNINPMPYIENDFKRIEKRVGRVTPIFEFKKEGINTTSINIIFRECEQKLENILQQYEERIKAKLSTNKNEIHLNIIYSTVLDQHNYWFKEGNFIQTIKFLNKLDLNVTSMNFHMQKLNIDGFNLLVLGKYISDKGTNLRNLCLNFRDNSFEGQLIVDLGQMVSKLNKLEYLELDFQNIIIYNQNQIVNLFESIIALKQTLISLVIYLPKDLNITYYESSTISNLFSNILSTLTKLDRLSIYSDSRFQFRKEFYQALQTFINSVINLIRFDLIFYCDFQKESIFYREIQNIMNKSQKLTQFKFVNYSENFEIDCIQNRYLHLLMILGYHKNISQYMIFKQNEILYDLYDI